ncbi:hypothetical protein RHMOL_Rhmol04G0103700 [Rhododendron molle]|nr:hypothetical protein RHMOL_Rhmol04G0103700 [Rhododendron molle]
MASGRDVALPCVVAVSWMLASKDGWTDCAMTDLLGGGGGGGNMGIFIDREGKTVKRIGGGGPGEREEVALQEDFFGGG